MQVASISGTVLQFTCSKCGQRHVSLSRCPTCDHEYSKVARQIPARDALFAPKVAGKIWDGYKRAR